MKEKTLMSSSVMEKLQMKMEDPSSSSEQPETMTLQQHAPKKAKGGLITLPFIIANEAFEKVASYGLQPNMILYLLRDYNLRLAAATNIIFFFNAATNFMPLLGAFLSDSYLGRYLTIGLGSISSLLVVVATRVMLGTGIFTAIASTLAGKGMVLLWLTAMIPQARPLPCSQGPQTCSTTPTSGQMAMLVSSYALMSVGAGGIRSSSMAFGADQVDNKENPNNQTILERFFNWYYASTGIAVMIALTVIVYIQDHCGWKIGFGVPVILMLLSAGLFFFASAYYIKEKANKSLFTGLLQVPAVAYKNRKVSLPPTESDGWYHHEKDSQFVAPTNKLRFLNKACIIRNPNQDLSPDGSILKPWNLCAVQQVEELKALLRVLPIWSSCIMMSINTSQGTFPVLQATSMDRHLTSSFQIPAGSFSMFLLLTFTIWIIFYDRAALPLAAKIKGKPVRLGVKLRMGIGLVFSCLAMVVSGIVENVRRRKAIQEGYLNNPQGILNMSAMWLIPQFCLNGFAEAFNAVGQIEFYYSEMPKTMSSIATSLFGIGMAVANLLASAIFNAVDNITSRRGRDSWVSTNINKSRFDNYYWLLAIMSCLNLLYFWLCCWAYGPCVEQVKRVANDGNGFKEEEVLANTRTMIEVEGKELEEKESSKV